MTGTWLGKVGNLSPNPDIAQNLVSFKHFPQVIGERGDGEDHRLKWGKVEFEHGLKYKRFGGPYNHVEPGNDSFSKENNIHKM